MRRTLAVLASAAMAATILPALPAAAASMTYDVTKTTDDAGTCDVGDCSLREAIIAANANPGHDTINVPAGTYVITIGGSGEDAAATGDLDITDNVTILGAGSGTTIVDGGGDGNGGGTTDRVFDLRSGAIGLTGLTITNGDVSGNGGGLNTSLDNPVTLGLRDVVIDDNHATTTGGGAYVNEGTVITGVDVEITDNTATSTAGMYLYYSTLHLTDSIFDGNTASGSNGALDNQYSQVRFWNVDITDNTATQYSAIYNYYGTLEWWGGSLSDNSATEEYGLIYDYESVAEYNDLTIDGNTTTDTGSIDGGLWYIDYGNTIIRNSPISDSTITTSSGSVDGGIFYVYEGARLELIDSPISNTTVTATTTIYGGVLHNYEQQVSLLRSPISMTTVTGTTVEGGAIYNYYGDTQLVDSSITGTDVTGTGTTYGGAAYMEYGRQVFDNSDVSGTTIDNGNSDVEGGGIYGYYGATVVRNSNIDDNLSDTTSEVQGGGIYQEYGGLQVIDSSVDNNTAGTGNNTDSDGGGIYVYYAGALIEGSSVSNNSTTEYGGGVGAYEAGVTIRNSQINDNTVVNPGDLTEDTYGGGISSAGDYGQFLLEDVEVMRNSATYDGGGIWLYDSGMIARVTKINDNTVDGTDDATDGASGGGISTTSGYDSIVLERSEVSGNTAVANGDAEGGGIYNYEYAITLVDSVVSNNTARTTNTDGTYHAQGGGVYIEDDYSPTLFDRSLLAGNSAEAGGTSEGHGGGVYIKDDGSVEFRNSTISGNSATTAGGAVSLNSYLWLASSTVVDNTATTGEAFDAAAADSEVHMTGTLVQDNGTADDTCAGLGTFTSSGYNLLDDGDADCGLTETGDNDSIDVPVGALAANGGPTMTHALPAASPAIDAGAAACKEITGTHELATDQRGAGRPVDGDGAGGAACDVGAYEYAAGVTIVATDAAAAEDGPDTGTFTVTRNGTAGDLTVMYTVTGSATSGDDYTALTGSVVIPDGDASATITVTPIKDAVVEAGETVVVTLDNAAAYAVGMPGSATVTITDHVGEGNITRVAGVSREYTAVEVSRAAFDSADTVVIARSDDFADALAGAPYAAKLDGPILLTRPTALSVAAANEIGRLGATKAVVLGGSAAVSDDVVSELTRLGLTVTRVAGVNRYATAGAIAAQVGGTEVYVAKAADAARPASAFADALGVSALAAFQQRPILLVSSSTLPADTSQALTSLGVTDATIVGGGGAIDSSVELAINGQGVSTDRLFGATRYGTSVKIAEAGVAAGMSPGTVWLASGTNWPDALAAGPAVGVLAQTLLLVHPTSLASSAESGQFLTDNKSKIDQVRFVGGSAALSDGLVAEVAAALS